MQYLSAATNHSIKLTYTSGHGLICFCSSEEKKSDGRKRRAYVIDEPDDEDVSPSEELIDGVQVGDSWEITQRNIMLRKDVKEWVFPPLLKR